MPNHQLKLLFGLVKHFEMIREQYAYLLVNYIMSLFILDVKEDIKIFDVYFVTFDSE